MKQSSTLTRQLAQNQETHTMSTGALEKKLRDDERNNRLFTRKTVYRIYTEDTYQTNELAAIVARYFEGATIFRDALGLDTRAIGGREPSVVVEIVSSKPDALQRIANLAGDIRSRFHQVSVLVSVAPIDTFEVVADDTDDAHALQLSRVAASKVAGV